MILGFGDWSRFRDIIDARSCITLVVTLCNQSCKATRGGGVELPAQTAMRLLSRRRARQRNQIGRAVSIFTESQEGVFINVVKDCRVRLLLKPVAIN